MSEKFKEGDEVVVLARVREFRERSICSDGEVRVSLPAADGRRETWAHPDSVIPAADYDAALAAKATLEKLHESIGDREAMIPAFVNRLSPVSFAMLDSILSVIYRPEPAKPELEPKVPPSVSRRLERIRTLIVDVVNVIPEALDEIVADILESNAKDCEPPAE